MTPPPHPILQPYLTASHFSAVDSYYAGPAVRTKAPTSLGGVKKAKKTRAAYISRLRRAAYMKMLEGACEQAHRQEREIADRLEAEGEEKIALLQAIRALQDEMSERSVVERRNSGVAEVVAADFGVPEVTTPEEVDMVTVDSSDAKVKASDFAAAEVVGAAFWVAEVAAALEAETGARENCTRNDSAAVAELNDEKFLMAELITSQGAQVVASEFWAAQVVAADYPAVDVVDADFWAAEAFAAEEADKIARERSEMTVSGSRLPPLLWEDVDLDFGSLMESMQCTVSA